MRPGARERLLDSVLEALCEDPAAELDTARHLSEAGVSRAELEAELGDWEGLLVAVAQRLADALIEDVSRECERDAEWPARVARGLAALLGWLAARPDVARAWMCSLPARTRAVYRPYEAMLERLAQLLSGGRELAPPGTELPREVERLAVGAAEAIVLEEVMAGRARSLPRLRREILYSVLVPFLGPERAGAESRRAAY